MTFLNDKKCVKILAVYARFCTQAYGDLFSGVVPFLNPLSRFKMAAVAILNILVVINCFTMLLKIGF